MHRFNNVNADMKKLFLSFMCFAHVWGVSAQIKIADDAYKEQLTASKYVTEPIVIDNYFNTYDGTFLREFYKQNIVGDTLYTNGAQVSAYIVNHSEKTVSWKQFDNTPIPQGYYRVTGIFISQDEGSKEIADELYQLSAKGYSMNANPRYGEESYDNLLKQIKSSLFTALTLAEINTKLQERMLQGKTSDFGICGSVYHRLESMDSSVVYYTMVDNNRFFLPVKYYNFLCNQLKGKDVYLTYNNNGGRYEYPANRKLEDALTGTTIFQKDSLFRCIDVVLNDKLHPCCVLEGAKTGKFAVSVYKLNESSRKDDCLSYYSTPSEKMTIWQPDPYESAGWNRLIRDRHFSVSRYINTEERQLILAQDLHDIYAETKKFLALTEAMQKQAEARYKAEAQAKKAKRKQEFCSRFGNEFGELIAARKVALGMTPEMCKLAWGTPLQISNMVDATGNYTIWKYNLQTRIYFYNGTVARITN